MKMIVANWKMNGNFNFVNKFVKEINKVNSPYEIIVCPPIALIGEFKDFRYHRGSQNCFYEEKGAFTGETSPQLLKEIGCDYVLLGHSERRSIFHESDDLILKKRNAAIKFNLKPIVCIGEKNKDGWREIVSDQLRLFLDNHMENTIFAYEPVWSIGTGVTPTVEEIEIVFDFINSLTNGKSLLLYGGSVNANNAKQILNSRNVSGLLVGGASLKIDEFTRIIQD